MPDIKVILDFSPETKTLMAEFIAALNSGHGAASAPALPADPPADAHEPGEPEPAQPAPPARVVTNDEVLKKVTDLIRAGKKAEAREIVTAYAPGVSAIPADKCAEVMDKLNALTLDA
jgi:hypothetical protein